MSTIKLYRNCRVLEEKNFQVDNIETYLSTLVDKTYNNAQYVKQGLDAEVKVVLDQDYLEREITNNYNYCRIDNGGGSDDYYYYFIREMVWTAKNCIKLVLRLDVLNTFNGYYNLTNKTTINRQHKDRFETYPYISNELLSFLDDDTIWDWGSGVGEIVGKATFQLPEEFYDRNYSSVITLVQGSGADIYTIEYDKQYGIIHITAYVQGEESQIPQGQIKITTTAQRVIPSQYVRKVDEVQEGFETVLWGKSPEVLTQNIPFYKENFSYSNADFGSSTWFLTYQTENGYNSSDPDKFVYNNPVRCFLTTNKRDYGYISGVDVEITRQQILDLLNVSGVKTAFITLPINANGRILKNSFILNYPDVTNKNTISVNFDVYNNSNNISYSGSIDINRLNDRRANGRCLTFVKDDVEGSSLYNEKVKRDNFVEGFGSGIKNYKVLSSISKIVFHGVSQVIVYASSKDIATGFDYNLYDVEVNHYKTERTYSTSSSREYVTFKSFEDVDRTSQKLIKIINVPYCPVNILNNEMLFNTTENELTLSIKNTGTSQDPVWIGNFDPSFNTEITLNINKNEGSNDQYSPLSEMKLAVSPNTNTLRNDIYESKLYHSDFYQCKFVYDSFDYIFRLELLDTKNVSTFGNTNMEAGYSVSNSVASAFGFDFSTYFPLKKEYQNYNVMIVNRNNEMPIYNNNYLNYLRNGYNYDIKNKQTRQIASGIGTGLGIATTVAGIALAASGYGSALGAGMIVSGVATTAGSLTSAISNSVQADRAMQQKLDQARNQAASVQGSDDIGLLRWYADNNLCKLMKFELSEATKERIADLFYYCGYRCDYQDIPNTTSRYWFNFVQCDPVYDESISTAKMSREIKLDLTTKYQQGVTVLHNHNSTYDFDQVKENWETSLLA